MRLVGWKFQDHPLRSFNRKIPSRTWRIHVINVNMKYSRCLFALLKFYNTSHIECRSLTAARVHYLPVGGYWAATLPHIFAQRNPKVRMQFMQICILLWGDRTARTADENVRFIITGYFLKGDFAAIFIGTPIQNDIPPILVLYRMQRKFRYCTP